MRRSDRSKAARTDNQYAVVATESYESFAESLQSEIEADTGIEFGAIQKSEFANIAVRATDGSIRFLGSDASFKLSDYLRSQNLIDQKGKIEENLRKQLQEGSFSIPADFKYCKTQIFERIIRIAGKLEIKNTDERRNISCRRAVLESEEFRALWDRIKYKTTYRVLFDNEKLENECINAIKTAPTIPKATLKWRKADISIGKSGVLQKAQLSPPRSS
ncbi:MAG TPA: hypothetical protein PKX22_06525 [Rectinema sp.]|nr:hypothetical protein [Rectinema sp.]HNZ93861.1 hypothetical protein [Rectinema sp.]HOH16897.1 hypothetical protein [Rectinema sp.]HPW47061.1 hypothetical protein [Rectinema sp.]HQG15489.1 hypothetical protein [Rectinema sp.]